MKISLIINCIDMWFKKKKVEQSDNINNEFSIEYYPYKDVYVAKIGNRYLQTGCHTGIIETRNKFEDLNSWGLKHCRKDAIKLIEQYKEQKYKKTVTSEIIK